MNLLFLEFAKKIKNTPAIPDAIRLGMIAIALVYSERGNSPLAREYLNFFGMPYREDLKRYARARLYLGRRMADFDTLENAIGAFLFDLTTLRFAGWQLSADSVEAFLIFYSARASIGKHWPEIRAAIPEARAVMGAL
jgi:hypothetical protein